MKEGASKGFIKDGNKNRLRSQDVHKVVDAFTSDLTIPRYSRRVPLAEIAANDYNLNIPRYIDSSSPEDLHDLVGHLQGGIPNQDIDQLQQFWQVFPNLRDSILTPLRPGYSQITLPASDIKAHILQHPEFTEFANLTLRPFTAWAQQADLGAISIDDKPKDIIQRISEDLLQRYASIPLLDKYDMYQILMNYWSETLQDDVYVLVQEGWSAGKKVRELVAKKGEKLTETADLTVKRIKYKMELIPPALIVQRYFAAQQTQLDQLQATLDDIIQQQDSFIEEHTGEEGLLTEALSDTDKVTKTTVTARLKHATDTEEREVLEQAKQLFDLETSAKAQLKTAQEKLDAAVLAQYGKLSEVEIKQLLVEDKWLATLQSQIEAEIERITQQLASRLQELKQRYSEPMPEITANVEQLSLKVAEHLKAMGLTL